MTKEIIKEEWQSIFLNTGTDNGLGDLSMMISTVSDIIQSKTASAVEEERKRLAKVMSRIVRQAVDESPGGKMETWERTISDFIRLEIALGSGKEDLPEIINPSKE